MQSYEEFRRNIGNKIIERLGWKDLATFVLNRKLPIYSWLYYKEGFSKELVEKIIEIFNIREGDTVLDSFCGVGTTLLTCKDNSINAIGYDVLPIAAFASRVKTNDYNIEKLKENARRITKCRFIRLNHKFPHLMNRAFNKYALEDIAFLRSKILELDKEVREFFVLALINSSLTVSYAYKDGSSIKFRKKPHIPLRKVYRRTVSRMIKDIEKSKQTDAKTDVSVVAEQNDARRLPLGDECIDAVITSPPYLNQIDYTKVYEIEEFFIQGEEIPGVRAYIGLKSKETGFLSEIYMPLQARIYFEDMNEVLKELYRVLKKNSHAAIVVGNGYIDGVIESDIILSYLAERIGFSLVNIFVLNKRFALEERTIKKGILRESLIILKK